jgi:hypothetical protein
MIYWFFKEVSVTRTDLPKRFLTFLQTEKRNWRKNVFYVDYETTSNLVDLSKIDFADYCTTIANYIHHSGCDIVIYSDVFDDLKINTDKIMRVYLYPKKGEIGEQSYNLTLCADTPNQSYNRLIQYINEL